MRASVVIPFTDQQISLAGMAKAAVAIALGVAGYATAAGFFVSTPSERFASVNRRLEDSVTALRRADETIRQERAAAISALDGRLQKLESNMALVSDWTRAMVVYRCLNSSARELALMRLPCHELLQDAGR